jgi:hypothetical protein
MSVTICKLDRVVQGNPGKCGKLANRLANHLGPLIQLRNEAALAFTVKWDEKRIGKRIGNQIRRARHTPHNRPRHSQRKRTG